MKSRFIRCSVFSFEVCSPYWLLQADDPACRAMFRTRLCVWFFPTPTFGGVRRSAPLSICMKHGDLAHLRFLFLKSFWFFALRVWLGPLMGFSMTWLMETCWGLSSALGSVTRLIATAPEPLHPALSLLKREESFLTLFSCLI